MGTSNTFQSMAPDFKETYSDTKKKKRFSRLKKSLNRKATAELDASKDPQAYMNDKSYLNLKGKKGVAI